LAYFTDPMGDEFKKAMEEAMKEMEEEEKRSKRPKETKARKKPKKETTMKHLSKKTKESLR
jgi:hypothetical protein